MQQRQFPVACPSCGQALKVKRLGCPGCGTAVEGDFDLPQLARLVPEDQEFIANFVKLSGSLKALARHYRVSYPTVRNRIDAVIDRLRAMESPADRTEEERPS